MSRLSKMNYQNQNNKKIKRRNKKIKTGFVLGLSNNFVKADSEKKPVYIDSRVVKSGETLWSIAKSYKSVYYTNTKDYVEAIKECNNLYSDDIYAGTSLIIPYTKWYPYTSADTVSKPYSA